MNTKNPVLDARELGLSLWFDNLRRAMLVSGELETLIEHDGIVGVTSNPSLFEKAIAGSTDYDDAIRALVAAGTGDAKAIYERLAIDDIQSAADLLRPVYDRTDGRDGFVSLEVSPYLAHDTEGTVKEASRLFEKVSRDNVLIKVPATPEGVAAIERLIASGVPINVTLIFAVATYEAVAEAFLRGLEKLVQNGGDPERVPSVASFFLSRIDAAVDARIQAALAGAREPAHRSRLEALLGKTAIANAKLAYSRYQELYSGRRWDALAARGARPQRLLWASTSVKDPRHRKTLYVDELIGPDTVNTVPLETLRAFLAEGQARPSLTERLEEAQAMLGSLGEMGISLAEVTDELLRKGVAAFSISFDKLLGAIEHKRQVVLGPAFAHQRLTAADAASDLDAALEEWQQAGKVRRLWRGDATLWTDHDEAHWLGWLDSPGSRCESLDSLEQLARDCVRFRHVVLLGMGGSSLCPWLLRETFGVKEGHPELVILDSIDPEQIHAVERGLDLTRTLFVVASKSGSTLEPNALHAYFAERLRAARIEPVGARFIAITDPGTALHDLARREAFRHLFMGAPDVGGRYSALTHFGLVPAALMGLDVAELLERAEIMVQSCASPVPPDENPGVRLGVLLGTLARRGRDKVTLICTPPLHALGAWIEQLLAESTGKGEEGLVPVDGEPLGAPEAYGSDRVFVQVRLRASPDHDETALELLERAGHPVVRIVLEEPMDIAQEFFRWQMATAVAGSVLGLNPFDQPDVEAAKIAARRGIEAYEEGAPLAPEAPLLTLDSLRFFVAPEDAADLQHAHSADALLAAHLGRLQAGDYFAVNAFVPMSEANDRELQALRLAVRSGKRVATTLGYGPRYLHSTGQLHKGGPNRGVFLVLVSDDGEDMTVPGTRYSFGALKRAQALGDCEVLFARDRRLLRVEMGPDAAAGLRRLRELVERALGGPR